MGLIMDQEMSFAFETVFSHWQRQADGTIRSKTDTIVALQEHGYFAILLFVGLANPELSILRVATRKSQGGHDVPEAKLRSRFPRTQEAIKMASTIADMTLMFDNSRGMQDAELVEVAGLWLSKVAPI